MKSSHSFYVMVIIAITGVCAGIVISPGLPGHAPAAAFGAQSAAFGDAPVPAGINNVRDFGAVGNGIIDDTAAINRAIDALPVQGQGGAGTIYFPPGFYRVGNLNHRNRSIIFQGAGWGMSNEGLPGAAAYVRYRTMNGSFLLCDARAGSALNLPLNFTLNCAIRDLAILGRNAPGVTGISIAWNTNIHNVLVANFETGVSMSDAVGWHSSELNIRGCNVGLAMARCNICQFDLLKITWCKTHAIVMTWCVGNQFNSADIESNHCPTTIVLQDDGAAWTGAGIGPNPGHGCRGNVFENMWAENPGPPAWLLDVGASSCGNDFTQLHISGGTADRIHVAGPDNHFARIQQTPWGGGDTVVEVKATGTVIPPNIGVTGAGAATVIKK
jgi:hypothetical protein